MRFNTELVRMDIVPDPLNPEASPSKLAPRVAQGALLPLEEQHYDFLIRDTVLELGGLSEVCQCPPCAVALRCPARRRGSREPASRTSQARGLSKKPATRKTSHEKDGACEATSPTPDGRSTKAHSAASRPPETLPHGTQHLAMGQCAGEDVFEGMIKYAIASEVRVEVWLLDLSPTLL